MSVVALAEPALTRDALVAANINPETFLATDYLNHFNEVVMLMDMLSDMPDMVADVVAWQPKSYPRHFADTGFQNKDLAIRAYHAAPRAVRRRFDGVVADIDTLLLTAIGEFQAADEDQIPGIAVDAVAALHPLIERASAIINGTDDGATHDVDAEPAAQATIDALLEAAS